MQLQQLIEKLSKKELNDIGKILKGKKQSAKQLLLFNFIVKCLSKTIEKEEVFLKIFKKPFQKKYDYQWKNEVRGLKNTIYDYLVEDEFKKSLKGEEAVKGELLLKALSRRRVNGLFDIESRKQLKKVQVKHEPDWLTKLYDQIIKFHGGSSYNSSMSLEEQIELLENWQQQEIKKMLYNIRQIESSRAYLKRLIATKADSSKSFYQELKQDELNTIDLSEYEDEKSRYYELYKKSYLLRGEKRLEVMKEALELRRKFKENSIDQNISEIQLLSNIASALSAMGKFKEANKYLDESLQKAEEFKIDPPESTDYKRIYNLFFAGNYKDCIQFFEQNEAAVKSSLFYYHSIYIYCMAQLFLKQTDIPMRYAMEKLSSHEKFKHTWRYLIIIGFITDGKLDDAKRELQSQRKMILQDDLSRDFDYPVEYFFEQYFSAKEKKTKNRQTDYLNLKNEISKAGENLQYTSLATYWLIQQLKKETL
ncbi:MAG: tetratricopeptide repeat protein [Chitinophagales bacterium]